MDYGSSDTSTTSLGTNQFPISEVYVPSGTQTAAAGGQLTALEGGPASTDSASPTKRSAPASMYVKDGSNVTQGITTDAAVTGDTAGTQSAKLRGLNKMFANVWDSVNGWLRVKVMNGNANGQAIMSGSAPVAIASDQSPIPTRQDATVAVRSAIAYSASVVPKTGAAGPGYVAVSLFNPTGSGKLFSLYVTEWECDAQQLALLQSVTTDPNFSGTNKGSIVPVNRTLGSTNTSAANVTYDNTGASGLLGTLIKGQTGIALTTYDLIKPELPIEIQAGNGIILFIHQNANGWSFDFEWGEQ